MAAMLICLVLPVLCALCFSTPAIAASQLSNSISNSPRSPSAAGWSWQTWGPYRPNLYFGVRPQVTDTLLMGLMWASGENRQRMLTTLRDTCEQDDGMQGYGWEFYDTRTGGSQVIHDTQLHLDLATNFLKSKDGKNWAVRIVGTPKKGTTDVKTTIILHTAVEKEISDGSKSLVCENKSKSKTGVEATCLGDIAALGKFELQVLGDERNNILQDVVVNSVRVPEEEIWQAKAVFTDQVKSAGGDQMTVKDASGDGNMHFVQMTFQGPFKLTFTYRVPDTPTLDANAVDKGIDSLRSSFSTTLDTVFPRAPPFHLEKYAGFSQAILSNLLGGLGFFHGDSKVDYSNASEYQETDLDFWTKAASAMSHAQITTTSPQTLLSFTPSRPFFPRGFLWDEGFHLLPVVEWDLDLAVSVLQSWLNLMDDDGWIGREQILGPEARSRVPPQFQTQYPHYANPPTLSLIVPIIISKLTGASPYTGHPSVYISSPDQASILLKAIFPLLARHYDWFRRTQPGNFTAYPRPPSSIAGTGFRWRGRTPEHTLTSGLDDYPRANPPHPGELHLDALAWVGASASALQQVAHHLGDAASAQTYASHVKNVKHNLDALHWDPNRNTYCDSTIQEGKYTHICREGYLPLFPLLLGLMDAEHPNLPALLDLMSNPDKLWSPYGLRSLSKSDEGYGRGENYWRGAIWVNLNVLAVLRLKVIGSSQSGPQAVRTKASKLAADLRKRLVETVYESWEQTGFFWEQYSDTTGEGRRSRAFTGWTAAVILLMGLQFGDGAKEGRETSDASGGVMMSLVGALAFPIVVVAVIPALRKKVLGAVAGVVYSVLTWSRARRGGRGYEEVIDLDEYEP
ncbi:glycoside hydrolase family 63 protein [Cercophora newfieldiana]|uniref:Mannosyl-oligosaccharide glucosidase n=1 Tax=Cercophora newfieldiana TaxID=92897 RepID=A0AA39Y0P1_9PEZI|nr:glycoside hydrolase family 63 protein [Cercophora newfieldiana]